MKLIKYVCGNDSVIMEANTDQAEKFERDVKEAKNERDYDDACMCLEDGEHFWDERRARVRWGEFLFQDVKVKVLF